MSTPSSLTNFSIDSEKNNSNRILQGFGQPTEQIEKAHIKQHASVSKKGKMFNVKEHTDKRKEKMLDHKDKNSIVANIKFLLTELTEQDGGDKDNSFHKDVSQSYKDRIKSGLQLAVKNGFQLTKNNLKKLAFDDFSEEEFKKWKLQRVSAAIGSVYSKYIN